MFLSPRSYRLGKREAAVAATRERIVRAAAALYEEHGVHGTSMQAVARRADVAAGTVLHHFRTPDVLAAAVVEHLLATLEAPTEEAFAGATDLAGRVRALARELAAFYERSEPWYRIHLRDQGEVPAFREGERRFFETVVDLVRVALGPRADDPDARAATLALLAPAVFGALRETGKGTEEAADLVAEILVAWLEAKASESAETWKGTR